MQRGLGSITYDFSNCFFPKFKSSAKRGFWRQMTYLFWLLRLRKGGGVPPTRVLSKNIENPEIWPILGYFGLLWAGPAKHCCTPVYLPIEDFRTEIALFLEFPCPKIRMGRFLPPEVSPKPSKTLEFGLFWSIFVCSGLALQNSAAHQRTCIV